MLESTKIRTRRWAATKARCSPSGSVPRRLQTQPRAVVLRQHERRGDRHRRSDDRARPCDRCSRPRRDAADRHRSREGHGRRERGGARRDDHLGRDDRGRNLRGAHDQRRQCRHRQARRLVQRHGNTAGLRRRRPVAGIQDSRFSESGSCSGGTRVPAPHGRCAIRVVPPLFGSGTGRASPSAGPSSVLSNGLPFVRLDRAMLPKTT